MAPGPDAPDLNQGTGEPKPAAPVPAASGAAPASPAPSDAARRAPATAPQPPNAAAEPELGASDVAQLFVALDKAVRARRLYSANNPVYLNFLSALRDAFGRTWGLTNSLSVAVEEHNFRWNDTVLAAGEGRDNLAFLFYKDGIRFLTFLPTFEEELERFLEVVHRARSLENNADDDMVTILWEREFAAFQYSYVDALSEGLIMPDVVPVRDVQAVSGDYVRQDIQGQVEEATEQPFALQQGMPTVASSITRDDFEETMYFLDGAELDRLRAEVEKEVQRDLKRDVLNALFDRLDDRMPERQTEIVRVLRQLMPAFLARGDLVSASTILVELNGILEARDVLGAEQTAEARSLFDELSEPAVLAQLLKSLEEGAIDPSGAELGVFLQHLGAQALPLLIKTMETTSLAALQARLRTASEHLGRAHPAKLMELIQSTDEMVALGAVRLAGIMSLTQAAPELAALLTRAAVPLRRAATESLAQIRSGAALEGLQNALEDNDREVRVTAARGLATLRYQPARQRLEAIIGSSRLRSADLTEKIAFFEAYGAVANAESVSKLDRLLNGKNLLRQKQSAEVRACAAMALGRVGSPASRAALERAMSETHPMVRNAVQKALRQEVAAT